MPWGVAQRSANAVKEKWAQLLSKAKEEFSKRRKHACGTGGGGQLPPVDPVLQKIINRFEKDASFKGVGGGFETAIGLGVTVNTPPATAAEAPQQCLQPMEAEPAPETSIPFEMSIASGLGK